MKKKLQHKKRMIILFVALAILAVGGTLALSYNSTIIRNLFGLGYYRTVSYEEFVSPDDWKTCDITPKYLKVKNESNLDIAVRISYEEFWKAADEQTDLSLTKDNVPLAIIHFQNQNDWELTDGYYYYKNDVTPNAETSSLFESVEFNCQANASDDQNTCTTTATGQVCAPTNDDYNGAHYHLRIKVETIQADKRSEWMPDESQMLYGIMKTRAQTNGVDTNLDFSAKATVATGNGNGVNIRSGTENNSHPIYYYRGEVSDNNVIWGDYCWKILRTTETGGTKIFYNGPASNGTCANNNPSTTYEAANYTPPAGEDLAKHEIIYNDYNLGSEADDDEIGFVGYMYDYISSADVWYPEQEITENPVGQTYYVASDVTYSEGKYHLSNPVPITVSYDGEGSSYRDHSNFQTITREGKYYYACRHLKTTECAEAIYMNDEPFFFYYPYNSRTVLMINRYILTGGMKQPELYRRMLRSNVTDSNAKRVIDDWYEKNILGKTIESDLEDTVFCNDREITDRPLKSTQYSWDGEDDDWYGLFESYYRLGGYEEGVPYAPSYECSNVIDSFTKYSSNGNGDLKYSIGLMTGDEMLFAGRIDDTSSDAGYRFGIDKWGRSITAMAQMGGSGGTEFQMFGDGHSATSSSVLRPVVSLKYGTEFVEGGEGTLNNPYVVKQ